MKPIGRPININASAKKISVDNRIPLHFYYRIANNLLKQASIYREEKNLIDLYIILLRYSSLVSETIPFHRDYQSLLPKERLASKKKLLDAVSELESLKPVVQHQVNESNTDQTTQLNDRGEFSNNSAMSYLEWAPVNKQISLNPNINQPDAPGSASPSSWMSAAVPNQVLQFKPFQVERQFQKLSLSVPQPKEETLTRHSILGPNGLRGQWLGPTTGIRVQYPSNADLTSTEISSQNQDAHHDSGGDRSAMDSTHPSQTCFMSSVDLHTHYSYQVMLPEAVAIVMAPTDTTRTHGIFHLSDPAGVSVIRNCQERGFHPHEEPVDGCPIYEHCSHVYMNLKLKFKIIDLR
ncbi:hypothetical protein MRB53_031859 [Persea americana]|uniref:Uncharacterized protein n=1 Tax=Persea americana TaxID=3435 RepID=A0ACC2KQP8_PERAE|nr:hypothetical protein MRB53_031859 [Persea americana]